MGVTLISLHFPSAPDADGTAACASLLAALAERRLRVSCIVSVDFLRGLEAGGCYQALDALAAQELGIWLPPRELPEAGVTGGAWWAQQSVESASVLREAVAECRRLVGRPPTVLAADPLAYSPPLTLAAAQLGVPVLARAPFDDGGEPLRYAGSTYVSCHLDLGPLAGDASPEAWHKRLGQLRQKRQDAPCVLGCDLTPEPSARRRRIDDKVLAGLPDTFAAFGQLATYQELSTVASVPPYLGPDDVVQLAGEVRTMLRPLATSDCALSLAQLLALFAQAGMALREQGAMPDRLYPLDPLGPLSPTPPLGEALVRREGLLTVCRPLFETIHSTGHLPAIVQVGPHQVAPCALLPALGQLLAQPDQAQFKIPAGPLPQLHATRRDLRQTADDLAQSHPVAHGRHLRNAILAQAWTACPLN